MTVGAHVTLGVSGSSSSFPGKAVSSLASQINMALGVVRIISSSFYYNILF